MNTYERRNKIVEMVNASGSMLVSDFSTQFGVTEVTIRADLRLLEKKGLLIRFHGGAAKSASEVPVALLSDENDEVSLNDRYMLAADPKRRIAIEAAKMVHEGDTVLLDSGSTTKSLAEELVKMKNITIITNNLPAALLLSDNRDITLIVCGGMLRHKTVSLHGRVAEYAIGEVSANIMFVGADGLDCENGITTFNEGYSISGIMASVSQKVVVVTDSSKFGKKGLNNVLPISKIDTIITDTMAPEEYVNTLINLGKEVKLT
ncbi:DeoR/GlpR family DNA-binding transcription regulator [Brenneria populi]|uniref:DeoR/GlpR family DNA-binding transcription regulator n=1 Tax=Brenneria populi TaxID=1505588 RepID=A0ABU6JKZ0_9GAMM|nr:DeoR/GlpR family DNA-binding transcription regulator [Brenneria populi Li et al. 2015]